MSIVLETVSDEPAKIEIAEKETKVATDEQIVKEAVPEIEQPKPEPKKRGRPRKVIEETVDARAEKPKRGRPRKIPAAEQNVVPVVETQRPESLEMPDINIAQLLMNEVVRQQHERVAQRKDQWRDLISVKLRNVRV